ncbi:TetR/AcrR family transcriptional regulator [Nonomuraea sp. B12E4]|uniref:TetR/AcrR family transcriptional regulator n=1 Tax=Nonomuraea sp. B12E4 TaxID=3153564 RepID=UPI00325E4722
MARPRTFDEERVLDIAMDLFWANGYEATSTRDLCTAVGLDRSSLYNAFSSKHELFKRVLARYIEATAGNQFRILEDERQSAVERIRALLTAIIDQESATFRNGHGRGCLTVNTTVELAARDPEIAAVLNRDLAGRLDSLRTVIAAGLAAGEITSTRGPESLARFVNAVIAGIRVAAQGGSDRAALEGIADLALDALT